MMIDALTTPGLLDRALAQHEAETVVRQQRSRNRLETLTDMVQQKERERERLLLTPSEQEGEETRKWISGRLKKLGQEIKQLGTDVELEQRICQEPSGQRKAIKRLVEWGQQREEELQQTSIEDKRNILNWLVVRVEVWRADHHPRFRVWLFHRESSGPVLLAQRAPAIMPTRSRERC